MLTDDQQHNIEFAVDEKTRPHCTFKITTSYMNVHSTMREITSLFVLLSHLIVTSM
jgi:hypothetical protein